MDRLMTRTARGKFFAVSAFSECVSLGGNFYHTSCIVNKKSLLSCVLLLGQGAAPAIRTLDVSPVS